jgi:hypothetical protein
MKKLLFADCNEMQYIVTRQWGTIQGTPQGIFSELAPLTPFPQASVCSPLGGGHSLAVEGVGEPIQIVLTFKLTD